VGPTRKHRIERRFLLKNGGPMIACCRAESGLLRGRFGIAGRGPSFSVERPSTIMVLTRQARFTPCRASGFCAVPGLCWRKRATSTCAGGLRP
jgi:hypothetical protein